MEGFGEGAAAEGAAVGGFQVIQEVREVGAAGHGGDAQLRRQLGQGEVIQEGAFFTILS